MTELDPDSLTGVWQGLYTYPAAWEPGSYTATLIQSGASLSGLIHEMVRLEGQPAQAVNAGVDGWRDGDGVGFTKTYDGTGGWDHVVHYAGVISGDGTEIEGVWSIPGDWSGRFLMIRSGAAPSAARRKAFQEA